MRSKVKTRPKWRVYAVNEAGARMCIARPGEPRDLLYAAVRLRQIAELFSPMWAVMRVVELRMEDHTGTLMVRMSRENGLPVGA